MANIFSGFFKKHSVLSQSANSIKNYYISEHPPKEEHEITEFELYSNCPPVNLCLEFINNIVSQVDLVGMEVLEGESPKPSTDKNILGFLKLLQSPNGIPAPNSFLDIFKWTFKQYLTTGISGFVVLRNRGKNGELQNIDFEDVFNNASIIDHQIFIPSRIKLNNDIHTQGGYQVEIKIGIEQIITFEPMKECPYVYVSENENIGKMLLFVFRNHNYLNNHYAPPLKEIKPLIELYTYNNLFQTNFTKNGCRPEGIYTIKPMTDKDGNMLYGQEAWEKILEKSKEQLQGLKGKNAGKSIVMQGVEIEKIDLSNPEANKTSEVKQEAEAGIYSYFALTRDIVYGEAKYNNMEQGQIKAEMRAVDYLQKYINMINFTFQGYLLGTRGSVKKNLLIGLNYDNVDSVKELQFNRATKLYEINAINNEALTNITQSYDGFEDIQPDTQKGKLFKAEIEKNNNLI